MTIQNRPESRRLEIDLDTDDSTSTQARSPRQRSKVLHWTLARNCWSRHQHRTTKHRPRPRRLDTGSGSYDSTSAWAHTTQHQPRPIRLNIDPGPYHSTLARARTTRHQSGPVRLDISPDPYVSTSALHDLEHLKLLYNSILRDRKLPGPAWKRHNVRYREIPGKLCTLTIKIQELKQKLASGETGNVDYYALIGVRRGCSRSELERAHLLLSLRHKPDKATGFIERCELADERDVESVKERAKMSSLLLYRLVQKGYTNVMSNIMDEEAAEKQRKKAAFLAIQLQKEKADEPELLSKVECTRSSGENNNINNNNDNDNNNNNIAQMSENRSMVCSSTVNPAMFQGVFCRDIAVVGNLLSQVGFNRSMPVKYEALSC